MKNHITIALIFALTLGPGLFAQSEGGLQFSGTLDSRLVGAAGAGAGPDFSLGFETWANIRAQARLRDQAAVYTALNLIAASGSIAGNAVAYAMAGSVPGSSPLPASAFVAGENYLAALELERLYFRVKGEYIQVDTGLMRLPFGYSLVWGPSDFLNPRSPLIPEARPRGILGASFSAYPADTLKIQAFAASPKNPLSGDGMGFLLGLGGEHHWDRLSLQGLYAFEPARGDGYGIHRGGLSLKAELELGLTADALYTWDPAGEPGIEGLAAAAGFDYSLLDGDLYVLLEYLYSGEESSTAKNLHLTRRHYLCALAQYGIDDYTRVSLNCMAGLEDLSFSPTLALEYEPFQGMTLSFSARVPLDRDTFSAGDPGELGPENTMTRAAFTLKAHLRF